MSPVICPLFLNKVDQSGPTKANDRKNECAGHREGIGKGRRGLGSCFYAQFAPGNTARANAWVPTPFRHAPGPAQRARQAHAEVGGPDVRRPLPVVVTASTLCVPLEWTQSLTPLLPPLLLR